MVTYYCKVGNVVGLYCDFSFHLLAGKIAQVFVNGNYCQILERGRIHYRDLYPGIFSDAS